MSFLSRLQNRFLAPRHCGRPVSSRLTRRPTLEILEDRTCPSSLAYSTYLGGSGNDGGQAIAVDAAGNTYVAGTTASSNFPVTAGAYDTTYPAGASSAGCVAKFNPSGALIWATYLGGSAATTQPGTQATGGAIQAIAVDGSGNVYVTGYTLSSDFPTTAGAFQPAFVPNGYGSNTNGFVTKINATGTALLYSTYLGDGGSGSAIAVDASGNAYVTGETRASDFPTTSGAFQTTLQGQGYLQDAYVTKLNPTGTGLVYSSFLGGSNGNIQGGIGIAVNASGDAYVTGATDATNFPTTSGAFQTSNGTGGGFEAWNAFVTQLNPTGSGLVYSTYLGGSASTLGYGIVLDGSGNAYVAGSTASTNFPTTPGAFQTALAGGDNAFVTKLNPSGTGLVYSTYLGGSGETRVGANPISLDASGNVFVTGYTNSTNFPTVDPVQAANGGGYDAFVTDLNPSGTGLSFSSYLGGSGDEIGVASPSIAVGPSGNVYVTGSTSSTIFPTTPGAFQAANAGGQDAFVAKIATTAPFAAFNAKGEFERHEFEVNGSFTLGSASDGIAPLTENVTLQLGTFSITIPAGSFRQNKEGNFKFEGRINGVELEFVIRARGGNLFTFEAEGEGVNLTGLGNPLTVTLTIGNDFGSTTVRADSDR